MIKNYPVTLCKRLMLVVSFITISSKLIGQSEESITEISPTQTQSLVVDYLGEGAGASAILGFFFLDIDTDKDGVPDFYETSPSDDLDGDGLINSVDPDDDNDGILDAADVQPVGVTSMPASYFKNGTLAAGNGDTAGDYWQFLPNSVQGSGTYTGYYEIPTVYLYIDNNANAIPDVLEYTAGSNKMPPFTVDAGHTTSHAVLGSFEGLLGDWSYSGSPDEEKYATGRTIFYICDDDAGASQTSVYTNNTPYTISDSYSNANNQVDYDIYNTTNNQSTSIPQAILGTDAAGDDYYRYRWFDDVVVSPNRELVFFTAVFWNSGGSGVNTYYSKTEFNPDNAPASPVPNGSTTGDNFGGGSTSNWYPAFQNTTDHNTLAADVFGTGTTWAMIASSPTDGSSPVAVNPVNQNWVDQYENWTTNTKIIQYIAAADWFNGTNPDVNTTINQRYSQDLTTDGRYIIIRAKENKSPHFMVVSPAGDPNSFIIGVEDLFNIGDRDFDDEMFYVTFIDNVSISATKTDSYISTQCTGYIAYEVVIENYGTSTATNVLFNDTPDANTILDAGSVTTSAGSVTMGNITGETDVQVNIGSLLPGDSVTITFNVSVNTGVFPTTTSVSNQGTVSGNNFSDVLTSDPNALVHYTATISDLSDVLIDNTAPTITCPNDITVDNNPGVCEAIVNFTVPTDGSLRINTGTLNAGPSLATSGGSTNWASVAYNPDLNVYYSFRAGNTGMPFRTYDDLGNTLETNTTGFDFRGLWWNSNTNELQGNGVTTSGYRTVTLDGSGYATSGGITFVTGLNQPNNQSNGTYDYDRNEILFYHGGRLYSYDMEGNQLSDKAIINFPEASNGDITTRSIGYTGVSGAEIVIYSELNARVYFIDKATATYNGDFLNMPAGAPTPNNYGFAYANGYVFLREDSSSDPWVSYEIVIDDRLDNCDGTVVTQTNGLASGSLFPVGTTTVEFKATDASGNESVCSFDVTVNDAEAPNAICQNITIQLDATGNASITAANINNGSTDNCGVDSLALDIDTFDCTNIGTNNVTLTVTDADGNSGSCIAVVTVEDSVKPTMVCQNITVQLDATGNATITSADIDNGSSDACGIASSVIDVTTFDCTDIGTNNVILTITDTNGNSENCTAVVTVESSIEIDVLGNGILIPSGDVTPDTIDDTTFASVLSGGSVTNTFTIDNSTGTQALDITNIELSGAQAGSFSLGTLPTTVVAGTSVTFDITFTPATAGNHDATVTITNNDCDENLYTFTITGYQGVQAETLNFDGTDDYAIANINSSSTDFTLEAWFKADSGANGYRAIMVWQTTGPNKETSIEVRGTGVVRLGQYDYTTSRWQQVFSTTNVKDDQWHHVAAAKSGSVWTLYIDGVAEGTLTLNSSNTAYTGLTDFRIGNVELNNGNLREHFRGEIDEVRIWDNTRSCYEIQNNRDCELTGTETGLVAYYNFNQGVAGGYNPLETVLTDQTANSYDATLTNMMLNTTTSNWIELGSGVSTTTCLEIAPKIKVEGNAIVLSSGDVTPDTTDGTAFGTISTGSTVNQTFTITNDGGGDLEINGITIGGTEFSLGAGLTFPIMVGAGATQDFDVSFLSNSCTDMDFTGSVQIDTNDCGLGTFTYAISASVTDDVNPTMVCQDITVQLDAIGNATITAAQIDNGSSDSCGIDTITIDLDTFDCSHLGDNTVTLTVTDVNGNSETCTATVTVEDMIDPTLVCQDITLQLDAIGAATLTSSDLEGGSSDNCGYEVRFSDYVKISQPNHNNANNSRGHGQSFTATTTGVLNVIRILSDRDSSNRTVHFYNGSGSGISNNIGTPDYTETGVTLVNSNGGDLWTEITLSTPFPVVAGNTYAFAIQGNTDLYYAWSNQYLDGEFIWRYDTSSGCCTWGDLAFELEFDKFISLDCDDVGTQLIDIIAVDESGNSTSCTASVTIEDSVQPTIVCQDITVQLDATGNISITTGDIDNGSSDACGIASMTLDSTTFDCSNVGANTVTLTVTDNNGNMDSCTATVTVEDSVQPTVVCQDITVQLDATGNVSITAADIDNGSNDACGIVSMTLDTTSFDCMDIGTNTVTLTVTDNNGNIDSCTATVTVEDSVQPIVVCQDITVQLDGTGNVSITTADIDNGSSDACGIASMTLDTTAFGCSNVGTNMVTLTVTDVNGNIDSCTASVTIEDSVQPTVVCQDITVQLDGAGNVSIAATDIGNGSSDACGIASMVLDTNSFDCSDVGTNTVTLTVTDNNGNVDSCTATVTVEDSVQPTVVCQDITVQLDTTGNVSITAADIDNGSSDACGIASMVLDTNSFDCSDVGTNTVTLTVTDNNGNIDSCTATVTVEDSVQPTVVCQDITVQLDATGNVSITTTDIDNGSNDACGIASMTLDTTTFDCSDVGTNTVTLTVTDVNGNINSCAATVIVEDSVQPAVVCQDITLQLDATGNVSITATDIDNVSSDACGIASMTLDRTDFDCSDVGTNMVTLTVTDNNGNVDSCTATVTVEDSVQPTVVCQDITVQLDATGNVSITTANIDNGSSDACGIASMALDTTTFDCSDVGTNAVTLTVMDVNGNIDNCTATVTVEDSVQPTVVCQDITVQLDATGNVSITTADIDNGSSDACGIASMALDTTTFDCSDVGTNAVTLTVTDTNGNIDNCTATVTVEDSVQPTVVCQDITIQLDATGNASITTVDIGNGSSDACGIASMILDATTFDCSDVGTNTVTLTVMDVNGNSNRCTATVTVEDIFSPVAVCQDITVALDVTGNATIRVFDIDNGSTDNCRIASTSIDVSTFDCTNIGPNNVVLTVTDIYGNSDSCTAIVTVEDVISPGAICQDITVQLDATGNATITPDLLNNGSTDTCGIASVVLDNDRFDCSDIGNNFVLMTVTDMNGNTSRCTAIVTVEDPILPVAICQDITVQLDETGNASISADQIDNGSYNFCGNLSVSLDKTLFTSADIGANVVTLTATDPLGNSEQCTAVVTVLNSIEPVITLLGDNPQIIEYGAGYTELGAVVNDGFRLVIDASDFIDVPGTYAVRYNAMNTSDEMVAQALREVIVEDPNEPIDEDISITIYPNPANDSFTITGKGEIEAVVIYDMIGRKVSTLTQITMDTPISTTNLSTGSYWVQIYLSPKGSVMKRIMVEH